MKIASFLKRQPKLTQKLDKAEAAGVALVRIAEELAPRATNVCFEDQLVDGQLVFDYRMRSGVVQKSNALALMQSVGLEVT